MTIRKSVHRRQRIVPVRFCRAGSGFPRADRPDIDDRGFTGTEKGPIVGVLQGDTVTVRLLRQNIDNSAALFLKSSDTAVCTITSPSGGALPNRIRMDFQIRGVAGGNPRTAQIEVHFGSLTGPVIAKLWVWVFSALDVDIAPHMITIGQTGGGAAAVAPGISNFNAIMDIVRAIWRPCGVTFSVAAVRNDTVNLAAAGVVSDNPFPGELRTILNNHWQANHINVYFVSRIGTGNTLGYGFSRSSFSGFGLPHPGILVAAASRAADTMWLANDLAHEIGHFFGLWHPESQQPPRELEDTWSRRMLMHNYNLMRGRNPWPAAFNTTTNYVYRPRLDDAGYGNRRRGCLVTMKNLTQRTTDGECSTSRSTISGSAGPY